jgi:methionyl-tRNA synthetase
MPARTFTRQTIKWRPCEACGREFPDSRKDRRFDRASCRVKVCRAKKRLGAIEAKGGKCQDCGKKFDQKWPAPFFVLKDGTVLCGADLSRRSREKFYLRWPKGQKGYRATLKP